MGMHSSNPRLIMDALRRLAVALALCGGYLALASLLYPALKDGVGGLSFIPVILVAWWYGPRWGGASGFCMGLSIFTLLAVLEPVRITPVSPLIDVGLGTLVGLEVGRISDQGKALRVVEKELEQRVRAQTTQLSELVEELRREVAERKQAEEVAHLSNAELERRVAERTAQLEAANAELQAFSYSVSHDLRAPLRAIAGFAKILSEEFSADLDPQALGYLRRIRESTAGMGMLINDLLQFSRIGRQEIKKEPVDLMQLVRAIYAELRESQPGEGRHIEFSLGALPRVEGDLAMLKQAFANLLSNAIKYSRNRDVAMIEVGSTLRDAETVIFVRDNGAGFDMQYAGQLFGVFQRLHREEEFEGTGVGLAIVKRIVEKHGGHVWAEAAVDQGATFYFTLRPVRE